MRLLRKAGLSTFASSISCKYLGCMRRGKVDPIYLPTKPSIDKDAVLRFEWGWRIGHQKFKVVDAPLGNMFFGRIEWDSEYEENVFAEENDDMGEDIPAPDGWEQDLMVLQAKFADMVKIAKAAANTACAQFVQEFGVRASYVRCVYLGQQQGTQYAQHPLEWTTCASGCSLTPRFGM